ncbi:HEXXH motif domain-containing protein [Micromonospora sp. NPDC023737]|uniref:HEXXH motif domain-containing protein n=1 Tax=unclassified Micromonospora TaxID=2617518 RepID=UPI0033FA84D6
MSVAVHHLPLSVLDELAAGRGGVAAIERLRAAQSSKTLLLVRTLVLLSHETRHPDRKAVETAYRFLIGLRPEERAAALGHPPVAAWAFGTATRLRHGDPGATYPALLAAVAVAAAVRAGIDASFDVPLAPTTAGRLHLPGLGTVLVPPHATRAHVRCLGGRAQAHCAGERVMIDGGWTTDPRWRPVPRLDLAHDGLRLSLLVDTPTWWHVPAAGAGHPLGGLVTDAHQWRHRLGEAWQILVDGHRPVAEEVSAAMRAVVPIPAPRAGARSGTYHHAFGSIAMSMPPAALPAAVMLAHEVQHLKLAAVTDMFALVEPGPTELFYAPWRPDPRPLAGLLHGAYAHLAVADFWRRQARMTPVPGHRHHALVQFARWAAATSATVQVLDAQQRLTTLGTRFVRRMADVLESWATEAVPPEAAAAARRLLTAHRARWRRAQAQTG